MNLESWHFSTFFVFVQLTRTFFHTLLSSKFSSTNRFENVFLPADIFTNNQPTNTNLWHFYQLCIRRLSAMNYTGNMWFVVMFFLLSSFGQIKTIGFEKFSLIWSFLEFVGFRRYLQPVVEIVFFPSQCRTLFYLSIFPWACIIFFPTVNICKIFQKIWLIILGLGAGGGGRT